MEQKIRDAFDTVRCDDMLKGRTKRYVMGEMKRRRVRHTSSGVKWAVSLACLVLFVGSGLGGYQVYYTEAATISIDVNPSIELGINRWGKVVDQVTYGRDSEEILSDVSLKHLEYEEALERLLSSEAMQSYLEKDALVSITLENRNSDEEMLANLKECVDSTLEQCHQGARAEYASVNEHMCQEAHSHGMSVGKYYAITELMESDPKATVEEFRDKSMKEIKGHMEHCGHSDSNLNSDSVQESQGMEIQDPGNQGMGMQSQGNQDTGAQGQGNPDTGAQGQENRDTGAQGQETPGEGAQTPGNGCSQHEGCHGNHHSGN